MLRRTVTDVKCASSCSYISVCISLYAGCVIYLTTFYVLSLPPSAELMFLETSALTGENVEEGFLKCARTILNKIDSGTRFLLSIHSYSLLDALWISLQSGVRVCIADISVYALVSKVSWTQRGWVQVSSTEMLH